MDATQPAIAKPTVGATFDVISRNIDIAPASVIALADGVGVTMAIYLLHGVLVGWLGLDPLTVTFAAWIWARGLAISLTNATTIPFHYSFVEA